MEFLNREEECFRHRKLHEQRYGGMKWKNIVAKGRTFPHTLYIIIWLMEGLLCAKHCGAFQIFNSEIQVDEILKHILYKQHLKRELYQELSQGSKWQFING